MDYEPRCDDGTLPTDCAMKRWYGDLKTAMRRARQSIAYSTMTGAMLRDAGFSDVEDRSTRIPLNEWHSRLLPANPFQIRLGMSYLGWMEAVHLEGLSMQPFTLHLGKTAEEVRIAARDAADEMRRVMHHSFNEL